MLIKLGLIEMPFIMRITEVTSFMCFLNDGRWN